MTRLLALSPLLASGCAHSAREPSGQIEESVFGTTPAGETVRLFTLTNARGRQAKVMTWGAALTSLTMPDRNGALADIVLGLDTLDDYLARSRNFGTIVGRVAGRIAGAAFTLDGAEYKLAASNGGGHSHGGPVGFAKRNWTGEAAPHADGPGVRMILVSADGDQGYPGELTISVTYRLTHDDRLTLAFEARTTRPTVLNPTHHSYFNLSGEPGALILDHIGWFAADTFTPFDANKLVTGEIRSVDGTALDFRQPKPIGRDIDGDDAQLRITGGYDHNVIIRGELGELRPAARFVHPGSGRVLDMWTTEPGVQFYTANSVEMIGRGGAAYHPRCGFALEPQHFQNSPNRPEFPPVVLRPGEVFRSATEYRFGAG